MLTWPLLDAAQIFTSSLISLHLLRYFFVALTNKNNLYQLSAHLQKQLRLRAPVLLITFKLISN